MVQHGAALFQAAARFRRAAADQVTVSSWSAANFLD
jgi:hypothetical protein